jgi:ferritin-like metal-binding protein YciE
MTALLKGLRSRGPMEMMRSFFAPSASGTRSVERCEVVSFEDLYHEQLQDMHSCERQLSGTWMRLRDAATHPQLKGILAALAVETRRHLERLHRILEDMESSPDRAVCLTTSAIVAEGCAGLGRTPIGAVCDARILCAGQKFQHHQIASYGSLSILAELLLRRSDRVLLNTTLQEESGTQGRFASLASAYVAVVACPDAGVVAHVPSSLEQEVMAHA